MVFAGGINLPQATAGDAMQVVSNAYPSNRVAILFGGDTPVPHLGRRSIQRRDRYEITELARMATLFQREIYEDARPSADTTTATAARPPTTTHHRVATRWDPLNAKPSNYNDLALVTTRESSQPRRMEKLTR